MTQRTTSTAPAGWRISTPVFDFREADESFITAPLNDQAESAHMAIRRAFRRDVQAFTGIEIPLKDIYAGYVSLTPAQVYDFVEAGLTVGDILDTRVELAFAISGSVVYWTEVAYWLDEDQWNDFCDEKLSPIYIGPEDVEFILVPKTASRVGIDGGC